MERNYALFEPCSSRQASMSFGCQWLRGTELLRLFFGLHFISALVLVNRGAYI